MIQNTTDEDRSEMSVWQTLRSAHASATEREARAYAEMTALGADCPPEVRLRYEDAQRHTETAWRRLHEYVHHSSFADL